MNRLFVVGNSFGSPYLSNSVRKVNLFIFSVVSNLHFTPKIYVIFVYLLIESGTYPDCIDLIEMGGSIYGIKDIAMHEKLAST